MVYIDPRTKLTTICAIISTVLGLLLEIIDDSFPDYPYLIQLEWLLFGIASVTFILAIIFQVTMDPMDTGYFMKHVTDELADMEVNARTAEEEARMEYERRKALIRQRESEAKKEYEEKMETTRYLQESKKEMSTYRTRDQIASKYLDSILRECFGRKHTQHDLTFWCSKEKSKVWEVAASSSSIPKKVKDLTIDVNRWLGSGKFEDGVTMLPLVGYDQESFCNDCNITEEEHQKLIVGINFLIAIKLGEFKLDSCTDGELSDVSWYEVLRSQVSPEDFGIYEQRILGVLIGRGKSFTAHLYKRLYDDEVGK